MSRLATITKLRAEFIAHRDTVMACLSQDDHSYVKGWASALALKEGSPMPLVVGVEFATRYYEPLPLNFPPVTNGFGETACYRSRQHLLLYRINEINLSLALLASAERDAKNQLALQAPEAL